MTVSYKWLQTFFNSPLPSPNKLAEILTAHCFEVESVEKKGIDYAINIDVLPDRAGDCLSHYGIAREISVLLDKKLIVPSYKVKENKEKVDKYIAIKVEDGNDCRRYSARVLKNVKIGPSPKWLKERLVACGLNSINNVVDVTNYVMMELGQPLHAFDYEKIGREIVVRRAKRDEKMVTLSDKEYILNEKILLITDGKRPLALAGIKGGKGCEITNDTKTIVLESANFNHKLTSQSARRLNLRTDASIRYENNLDPNLTEEAINRAAALMQEVAQAEVVSGIADVYKSKLKPWTIKLEVSEVNRIIGVEIKKVEMVKILTSLGFGVKATANTLTVTVPTYRQDVVIPENLIEEVGRIYGYDNVPAILPCFSEPAQVNKEVYWQNKAKDIMKELGFIETYGYSLLGHEENEVFGLDMEEILNPVSSYFKYMRTTLVPQMAKIGRENAKFFKEFKYFELGKILTKKETMMLSGGVVGSDFAAVKESLNYLFNKLGVSKVSYAEISKNKIWHNKKTAEIKIGATHLGYIGSLSADISEVMGVDNMILFELNFDEMQKHCSEKKEYKPISYHPPALRDISGVVPESLKIEEIVEFIKNNGGGLLKSAEAFDVYKGKGIPENKKSVSFHLIYQSDEKTLDTKTIDYQVETLINKLKETINWEERK